MATLLSDTFTDSNATALTAHTMNVGPGWTAQVGTFVIQSNTAQPNSANDGDQVTTDAGQADYTLTCDVVPVNSGPSEYMPQLMVRWTDASNQWIILPTSFGGLFDLYEVVATVATRKATASFAFSSGTSYSIKIVASGSTISGYVNNALQWAYASATSGQTKAVAGLRTGKSNFPITVCSWDNFLVVSPPLFNQKVVMAGQSVKNASTY
jgi:hypothetical protein